MNPGIELFRVLPAIAIRLVRQGYRASSERTGGIATDPITSREAPAQDARTSFRHPQDRESEGPNGSFDRVEFAAYGSVARDAAAVLCVEYVDEVAGRGDADRECAARVDHLAPREVVAVDREDRQGIAARVDCVQERVAGVVGQRALGRQVVDGGAVQHTAQSTGVVGVGKREGAVVGSVVGDDLVSGRVVGLDEYDMVGASGVVAVGSFRSWRTRYVLRAQPASGIPPISPWSLCRASRTD
jgi:hypothetical protein